MTIKTVAWLWLVVWLYGFAAWGYRFANCDHFPLRSQTGDLIWLTDVFVWYTSFIAIFLVVSLGLKSLTKRIGESKANRILIITAVLGLVLGWLISLVLHAVYPSLYQGWS